MIFNRGQTLQNGKYGSSVLSVLNLLNNPLETLAELR
jgi:hypothetical protein